MSEPTAEHLKAAQEWLIEHHWFGIRWMLEFMRVPEKLAALLASREQALREEVRARWDSAIAEYRRAADAEVKALREENERLRKGYSQRLGVRCGTCAMKLVGLPTPGYPHADDCAEQRAEAAEARLERMVEDLRDIRSNWGTRCFVCAATAALAAAQSSEER